MNLIEKIRYHLKKDDYKKLSNIHIYQYTDSIIAMPQVETPYIYFIIDGSLRLHTPSGILDYVENQYSVSTIDTPENGYVLSFSKQNDFLATIIDFSATDAMSVIVKLNDELITKILNNQLDEGFKNNHDKCVFDCLERIIDLLEDPLSLEFLSSSIYTEMIFHILCGSSGKEFIQSITNMKYITEIYEVNSWIKKNYREAFKVEDLAEQWNMSVSQFHQKFKNAVGMGPLQCQKRLRLSEARRLMLDDGKNVTEAALDVGYESVSQFIREYRKMYGNTPKEDIQFIQQGR